MAAAQNGPTQEEPNLCRPVSCSLIWVLASPSVPAYLMVLPVFMRGLHHLSTKTEQQRVIIRDPGKRLVLIELQWWLRK